MLYAYISEKDNDETKNFLLGRKISKNNFICRYQLAELAQTIKKGDTIFVFSINRFDTINQFYAFARLFYNMGVNFQSICQLYLDIKDGKVWKESYVKQVEEMIKIEMTQKSYLAKNYKMAQAQWEDIFCLYEPCRARRVLVLRSAPVVAKPRSPGPRATSRALS